MSEPGNLRGRSCLVLGGGGFIGTNLCRYLLQLGARVQGFGRSRSFPEALDGVTWTTGDFADHAAVARAVEGNELVFHLVGSSLPESSNRDPAGDLAAHVPNTLHLLDVCRLSDVRKVIFASSGGTIYGIPQGTPIPETAPTDPIAAYGISKLAIEKYLALYHRLHGLDYAILRIANPFGPFQAGYRRQGVIAAFIERALSGETLEIWGDGDVVRDFVYIGDVVDALARAALYDGSHRLFNVGQGVGRSIDEVFRDIETLLGHGSLPKVYKTGRRTDVPVNVLDIRLIERELGWRPRVEWLSGLRTTIDWLVATGEQRGRD
ncbi:MAG TPA: NAD-dependent epimerase/dehydratase family protein [Stellaceae bacterium]|nr:NAD-dependent epimerase/dehydratase family protein [Stellaceae bacterium]